MNSNCAPNCDACRLENTSSSPATASPVILPDDRRLNHASGCGRYFLPLPEEHARLHQLPLLIRRCIAAAMSSQPYENVELFEPFRVQSGLDNATVREFVSDEERKIAREFLNLDEAELNARLETETDSTRRIVLSIAISNMQARRRWHVASFCEMDPSYFEYWKIELRARPNKPSIKSTQAHETMLISFEDSAAVAAAESVLQGKSKRYEHKEEDPEAMVLWQKECDSFLSKAPRSTRRIYRELLDLGFVFLSCGELTTKYAILYLGRLLGRLDKQGNHFATTSTPEGIKIELHWESFYSKQTEEVPADVTVTPQLVKR
jgi:hypothetical protein